MKALAAHPFHCPLSRDHWCECFVCATFSQPSSCGHQYGSSISTPFSLPSSCGLQYGSSISMPFSLPSSCGLQRTLGSPTPSLAVAYGHDACISRLKQLVRCLSHSQKRRMYISSMCRTWSLRNIGLSIDPLPQGRTPHFHTFYCFACTIYAILLTRPKP